MRNLDRAELTHTLFAFLLLFEKLFLSRYITAIALCENILTHSLYGLTCDDLSTYGNLYRDLEKLSWNVILELFGNAACSCIGIVGVYDKGERIDDVSGKQNIELDEL